MLASNFLIQGCRDKACLTSAAANNKMLAANFNGEAMDLLFANLVHCCSESTINIMGRCPPHRKPSAEERKGTSSLRL